MAMVSFTPTMINKTITATTYVNDSDRICLRYKKISEILKAFSRCRLRVKTVALLGDVWTRGDDDFKICFNKTNQKQQKNCGPAKSN